MDSLGQASYRVSYSHRWLTRGVWSPRVSPTTKRRCGMRIRISLLAAPLLAFALLVSISAGQAETILEPKERAIE